MLVKEEDEEYVREIIEESAELEKEEEEKELGKRASEYVQEAKNAGFDGEKKDSEEVIELKNKVKELEEKVKKAEQAKEELEIKLKHPPKKATQVSTSVNKLKTLNLTFSDKEKIKNEENKIVHNGEEGYESCLIGDGMMKV